MTYASSSFRNQVVGSVDDTDNSVAAVAKLAAAAGGVQELSFGNYSIVHTLDGSVKAFDLTGNEYLEAPLRKSGTVTVQDAQSFLHYWAKHHTEDSEVYADRSNKWITGVLNAPGGGGDETGFGDHRVTLVLGYSESLQAWKNIHGKELTQIQFAEFVEDHRADVFEPTSADLLEMALTFQSTTKVVFKSSHKLQSGQRKLEFVESGDASAGAKGDMPVPEFLKLHVPVFQGATQADELTARLRYRVRDGQLRLIVILDQLTDVVNTAFEGVINEIVETVDGREPAGVGVPVLRGTPAR